MKAARYYGTRDVRVEDLPDPEPGPGQVLIKVAHNGICGTDIHEYFAGPIVIPTSPHALTGAKIPVTLGHEFSGTVLELGDGVNRCAVGDHVAVRPTSSCGTCAACRRKLFNLCRKLALCGVSDTYGGLAEYAVVEQSQLHLLPPGVSLELGALVEPMAVAYHAVRKSEANPDDVAVVCGLGPIGIGLWYALRSLGVHNIVLSDPAANRRACAAALGASHVVDPGTNDLASLVDDLSNAEGAAVVFDAAGVGDAITAGLELLGPTGRLVVVALHESPFCLQPIGIVAGELEVVGSAVYHDDDFVSVIEAMAAGSYPTNGWVQHMPFANITDAIHDLRDGKGTKILIDL